MSRARRYIPPLPQVKATRWVKRRISTGRFAREGDQTTHFDVENLQDAKIYVTAGVFSGNYHSGHDASDFEKLPVFLTFEEPT